MNHPVQREQLAEIMFETFNTPGLYISVQAALAIAASWTSEDSLTRDLSGVVIDSGDGITHVIPVADGHVIGSGIKQLPLAGREVTNYILNQMRQRKEPVPPDQALETAKILKERYAYICPDANKHSQKYDSFRDKYVRCYEGLSRATNRTWKCNIEKEQFLGPEIMFDPKVNNLNVVFLQLSF